MSDKSEKSVKAKTPSPKRAVSVHSDDDCASNISDTSGLSRDPAPDTRQSVAAMEDVKARALKAFIAEEAYIGNDISEFNNELRKRRIQHLRQLLATMHVETPRIVQLIKERKYGNVLEDRTIWGERQSDALRQAEALFLKFRTTRGLDNLARSTEQEILEIEASIIRHGKHLQQCFLTGQELVKAYIESGDMTPRIQFLAKVSPAWHVDYELIYMRAQEWLYTSFLHAAVSKRAEELRRRTHSDRLRQDANALDIDMSDSDADTEPHSTDNDADADDDDDDGLVDCEGD